MDNSFIKHAVQLVVDGHKLGTIQDLTYNRDIKELPEKDEYRHYAPGDNITCDVVLQKPARVKEVYRLLNEGETLEPTDEWYSPIAESWYPLSQFTWKCGCEAVDGLYRRKALVLV